MLVSITEFLHKTVEVDANTKEDALSKVQAMYENEEIVLNAVDFKGEVYFEVVKGE